MVVPRTTTLQFLVSVTTFGCPYTVKVNFYQKLGCCPSDNSIIIICCPAAFWVVVGERATITSHVVRSLIMIGYTHEHLMKLTNQKWC